MTKLLAADGFGGPKRLKVGLEAREIVPTPGREVQHKSNQSMISFEFAYNNACFADRTLHLEITPLSCEDDCHEAVAGSEEESQNETGAIHVVEVVHVSSVLLAAHSEYFMRLFSNGMSESNGVAVVKVTDQERTGLQELIQYMYTGKLVEPVDAESAVTLLCLADRFAIASCMEVLGEVLKRLPFNLNDCLLILGLPDSLKSDKAVQPVVEQCRNYLAQLFQDVTEKQADFLSLTVEGVKVVLDSNLLIVSYEEEVFEILLQWLQRNFKDLEERKKVAEELAEVVRFPWMTGDFLMDVVAPHPLMQSPACKQLVLEGVTFKSFTHSRQHQMMGKKMSHNRYRARNHSILENVWGQAKTFTSKHSETGCQAFFEFPLELVICTGESFQSRPIYLGRYRFFLEARHEQVKTSYNQQLTCVISLGIPPSSWKPVESKQCTLQYTISMKRDHAQSYDVKQTSYLDLTAAELTGTCVRFTDFFSGWFIERGFSFPRWNLTINGLVFLRLDLKLVFDDGESQ